MHPGILSSFLLFFSTLSIGISATPSIEIQRVGNGFRLELRGEDVDPVDPPWIVQDSYDGVYWRDLGSMKAEDGETALSFFESMNSPAPPQRLFRAARKEMVSPQEALNEAREQWADEALSVYEYEYITSGGFGFWRGTISVEDGSVIEENPISTAEFHPHSARTIKGYFEAIQGAIDQDAAVIDVRYHPSRGYPESLYIDYDFQIADEEWSFRISPLRPPEAQLTTMKRFRSLWALNAPIAYTFHLRFETSWRFWEGDVTVEGGVVTKRDPAEGDLGSQVADTMDGYFSRFEAGGQAGKELSAHYDPATGRPGFISIDWRLTFGDGPGERYWISDFRRLEE